MQIRYTLIARNGDGLPLVATMESQTDEDVISQHKKLAKSLCKLLSTGVPGGASELPSKASVLAGDYTFHYAVDSGIQYITICDKAYPRLLAFSFLTEVSKGFSDEIKSSSNGWNGLNSVVRPYAFIRFEPIIQSTRKRYQNTRQLRPQEDLVELSSRIQSIPVLRADDVFGSEYSKSSAVSMPAFPGIESIKKTATSLTTAIHDATSDVLPSGGASSQRSMLFTALYWASLIVATIDGLSLLSRGLPFLGFLRGNEPADGIVGYIFFTVALLSPFVALQAYLVRNHGNGSKLPQRLADLTTVHALITLLLIFIAFFAAAGGGAVTAKAVAIPVSPSASLSVSPAAAVPAVPAAPASPAVNASLPEAAGASNSSSPLAAGAVPVNGTAGNDTVPVSPAPAAPAAEPKKPDAKAPEEKAGADGEDNAEAAAAAPEATAPTGSMIPFWITVLKIGYLAPFFFGIGFATIFRWFGQKGPKGRRD
ncbi:SNAP receptor [Phlyctochytrium bullatum]|nr:SNAP receptor [Phlyctochytrium bullatum]